MAKKAPADGKIVEQMVPLDELILDPANAREHGPDSIRVLKDSLELFGQPEAIVVQKSTRKVIAGNGRVAAARELGWDEIRANVIDVDNVTASAMALNRTAERSGWDGETLARTLKALQDEGFAIEKMGWEPFEYEAMIGTLDDRLTPVDDPEAEWKGMPEYDQDDVRPHRTIHVHFADDEAVQDFARLVGQTISERTKYIWHPLKEQVPHGEAR